jgi:hypothetical protein
MRDKRGSESMMLAVSAVLFVVCAAAGDFEVPPAEPAAASLPAELVTGRPFTLREPVRADGLMHHYELQSRFGDYSAYGQDALKVRAHEIAALEEMSKNNDVNIVVKAAVRQVQNQAGTVKQLATHPVKTVTGIPRGIGHLFGGYKAQAGEAVDGLKTSGHGSSGSTTSRVAQSARSNGAKYADRYLGVSAAERRFYQKLGIDPYTDNEVLRKAVKHAAKVDAATTLGLHFVAVPGLPYLGDVQRAMDAVYTEDPAVLRARRRKELLGYGLTPEELTRFDNTLLLSPTRQGILEEVAKSLNGVAGRDELFRHAMEVDSVEEVQVFIQSARLLAFVHTHRPAARILGGLRLPAAALNDGTIVVFGAFDAVTWTEEVAGYEAALHAALPASGAPLELWLTGSISPLARKQLTHLDWKVHDHARESLVATTLGRAGDEN